MHNTSPRVAVAEMHPDQAVRDAIVTLYLEAPGLLSEDTIARIQGTATNQEN